MTRSSLSAKPAVLSPVFSAGQHLYSANVPYTTSKVVIEATATAAEANASGTGKKELEIGQNRFVVSVAAPGGTTTQDYTVVITRNADLFSSDAVDQTV